MEKGVGGKRDSKKEEEVESERKKGGRSIARWINIMCCEKVSKKTKKAKKGKKGKEVKGKNERGIQHSKSHNIFVRNNTTI